MPPADAYAELVRRSKDVVLLNSCSAVLQWDQQTYMPRAGAALRGDQLALVAALAHEKATDPRTGELLAAVAGSDLAADPDSVEAANVRELRHLYDRAVKLPKRLVEELARVTTAAQEAWVQARAKNDFPAFRPWLERVIGLKREEAEALQRGAGNAERGAAEQNVGSDPTVASGGSAPRSALPAPHLYDALLDEYEPGATAAEVRGVFAGLSKELVPLIRAIAEAPRKPDRSPLDRDYPVDRQKVFAEAAAAAIGFDFAAGRLDTTAHPFCTGVGPGDCRITTRYNPRGFHEAFFGVLHEAGHGLYEQHLPADRFGTPAGMYCSLGIHESQSRLWENQVGRSRPFWDHFFPRLKQTFPGVADVAPDAFYAAVNEVRPSLIRVEADEATYNLHIVLRFELELDLLTGALPVADLPGAWAEKFRPLFGLTPPSDREGCLQDIHWSFGGFGYFPTYTLGNLYAAQLMRAARRDLGGADLDAAFRRGDFAPLAGWLAERVHRHGRRYRPGELCRRATGEPLGPGAFLAYLREKAADLYGVC